MFKINNKDTRSAPWGRSVTFIVNFENIWHLVLLLLLLTLRMEFPAEIRIDIFNPIHANFPFSYARKSEK